MTEEFQHEQGETTSIHTEKWPVYEEAALVVDEVEVVLQVNGKVRDKLTVSVNITKEELADDYARLVSSKLMETF